VTSSRLVIGLGSPDRGDDAVGPEVARRVAGLSLPGVTVVEHEDPTGLIDLWGSADLVVVVDAVRSGAMPGSLLVVEAGADAGPVADQAWARTGWGGTHAFGLAAAVELGRALHHLPPRLVLVGVEATQFEHGAPLGAPVAAALESVVAAVVALVEPVASAEPVVAPVRAEAVADVPR
jgi:hydrogenase maturation protease